MPVPLRSRIWFGAALLLILAAASVHSLFVVCWVRSQTHEPATCSVDSGRFLVLGTGPALLANTSARAVVRLSAVQRTVGPLLLWPRDSLRGVILGDGVKGVPEDSFTFFEDRVTVRTALSKPSTFSVRIP